MSKVRRLTSTTCAAGQAPTSNPIMESSSKPASPLSPRFIRIRPLVSPRRAGAPCAEHSRASSLSSQWSQSSAMSPECSNQSPCFPSEQRSNGIAKKLESKPKQRRTRRGLRSGPTRTIVEEEKDMDWYSDSADENSGGDAGNPQPLTPKASVSPGQHLPATKLADQRSTRQSSEAVVPSAAQQSQPVSKGSTASTKTQVPSSESSRTSGRSTAVEQFTARPKDTRASSLAPQILLDPKLPPSRPPTRRRRAATTDAVPVFDTRPLNFRKTVDVKQESHGDQSQNAAKKSEHRSSKEHARSHSCSSSPLLVSLLAAGPSTSSQAKDKIPVAQSVRTSALLSVERQRTLAPSSANRGSASSSGSSRTHASERCLSPLLASLKAEHATTVALSALLQSPPSSVSSSPLDLSSDSALTPRASSQSLPLQPQQLGIRRALSEKCRRRLRESASARELRGVAIPELEGCAEEAGESTQAMSPNISSESARQADCAASLDDVQASSIKFNGPCHTTTQECGLKITSTHAVNRDTDEVTSAGIASTRSFLSYSPDNDETIINKRGQVYSELKKTRSDLAGKLRAAQHFADKEDGARESEPPKRAFASPPRLLSKQRITFAADPVESNTFALKQKQGKYAVLPADSPFAAMTRTELSRRSKSLDLLRQVDSKGAIGDRFPVRTANWLDEFKFESSSARPSVDYTSDRKSNGSMPAAKKGIDRLRSSINVNKIGIRRPPAPSRASLDVSPKSKHGHDIDGSPSSTPSLGVPQRMSSKIGRNAKSKGAANESPKSDGLTHRTKSMILEQRAEARKAIAPPAGWSRHPDEGRKKPAQGAIVKLDSSLKSQRPTITCGVDVQPPPTVRGSRAFPVMPPSAPSSNPGNPLLAFSLNNSGRLSVPLTKRTDSASKTAFSKGGTLYNPLMARAGSASMTALGAGRAGHTVSSSVTTLPALPTRISPSSSSGQTIRFSPPAATVSSLDRSASSTSSTMFSAVSHGTFGRPTQSPSTPQDRQAPSSAPVTNSSASPASRSSSAAPLREETNQPNHTKTCPASGPPSGVKHKSSKSSFISKSGLSRKKTRGDASPPQAFERSESVSPLVNSVDSPSPSFLSTGSAATPSPPSDPCSIARVRASEEFGALTSPTKRIGKHAGHASLIGIQSMPLLSGTRSALSKRTDADAPTPDTKTSVEALGPRNATGAPKAAGEGPHRLPVASHGQEPQRLLTSTDAPQSPSKESEAGHIGEQPSFSGHAGQAARQRQSTNAIASLAQSISNRNSHKGRWRQDVTPGESPPRMRWTKLFGGRYRAPEAQKLSRSTDDSPAAKLASEYQKHSLSDIDLTEHREASLSLDLLNGDVTEEIRQSCDQQARPSFHVSRRPSCTSLQQDTGANEKRTSKESSVTSAPSNSWFRSSRTSSVFNKSAEEDAAEVTRQAKTMTISAARQRARFVSGTILRSRRAKFGREANGLSPTTSPASASVDSEEPVSKPADASARSDAEAPDLPKVLSGDPNGRPHIAETSVATSLRERSHSHSDSLKRPPPSRSSRPPTASSDRHVGSRPTTASSNKSVGFGTSRRLSGRNVASLRIDTALWKPATSVQATQQYEVEADYVQGRPEGADQMPRRLTLRPSSRRSEAESSCRAFSLRTYSVEDDSLDSSLTFVATAPTPELAYGAMPESVSEYSPDDEFYPTHLAAQLQVQRRSKSYRPQSRSSVRSGISQRSARNAKLSQHPPATPQESSMSKTTQSRALSLRVKSKSMTIRRSFLPQPPTPTRVQLTAKRKRTGNFKPRPLLLVESKHQQGLGSVTIDDDSSSDDGERQQGEQGQGWESDAENKERRESKSGKSLPNDKPTSPTISSQSQNSTCSPAEGSSRSAARGRDGVASRSQEVPAARQPLTQKALEVAQTCSDMSRKEPVRMGVAKAYAVALILGVSPKNGRLAITHSVSSPRGLSRREKVRYESTKRTVKLERQDALSKLEGQVDAAHKAKDWLQRLHIQKSSTAAKDLGPRMKRVSKGKRRATGWGEGTSELLRPCEVKGRNVSPPPEEAISKYKSKALPPPPLSGTIQDRCDPGPSNSTSARLAAQSSSARPRADEWSDDPSASSGVDDGERDWRRYLEALKPIDAEQHRLSASHDASQERWQTNVRSTQGHRQDHISFCILARRRYGDNARSPSQQDGALGGALPISKTIDTA
ncbi:hypothetical protein CBOM_02400 [Ceraceosorus bombacis]|uniref:Uncharacterized protein n=1 Tax=Ceraceosorus bombacis TaxID=401625 RepID=A0A0P1BGC3_9BASI|nr:hypothetical protein CBOM_02400 [Ceraceosorus bombacis]